MTTHIDVFNGDADGIFSLIQWRKAYPLGISDTQYLITGVKRDIALVSQIDEVLLPDSHITVLDISFDKNVKAVAQVLPLCAKLFYCDHHKADTLFANDKLTTRINTEPTVCTGLLINTELKGEYLLWAIAAAYGDGLDHIAVRHAERLTLSESQCHQLKQLGVLVNYNGYGSSVDDLYFNPASLYQQLSMYDSPFDIVADTDSPFLTLKQGYDADIAKALEAQRLKLQGVVAVILDDAPWARRISGTFGNQLAADNPDKPVVVVTKNIKGSYTISLRAPSLKPFGASTLCSEFTTGGGREGAAGINELPIEELDDFLERVSKFYQY